MCLHTAQEAAAVCYSPPTPACVCIRVIDVGLRQPAEAVHTCRSASISLITGALRSSAPTLKHSAGSRADQLAGD